MRTQIGIIGAGPAGLMLAHLLHRAGIDSVVLENRPRDYVIERVRAGVLEQATTDLMVATGVGDRLRREGMRHEGVQIAFGGRRHRIDLQALTGGRAITIYGQNEVVKDLIDARVRTERPSVLRMQQRPSLGVDGTSSGCSASRTRVESRRWNAISLQDAMDSTASRVRRFRKISCGSTNASIRSGGLESWRRLLRRPANSCTAFTSAASRFSRCDPLI